MVNLFVRILHMSIPAGYLILAVLAVRFLLKKAPKTMRLFLWLLVGIRLILPFSVESAFSLLPDTGSAGGRIAVGAAAPQLTEASPVAPDLPDTLITSPKEQPKKDKISGTPPALASAAGIWALGTAAMTAYMLVSWLRLKNRVKTAVPEDVTDDSARTVRIYRSEHIDSPFLLGILRPRIYIPEDIAENDIPYVVLHEKIHLKRRDYLIKPAGFLILALYWFHPLVWTAYVLLCRDIELLCDEQVIRRLGEPCKQAYSQALLDCAVIRRAVSACPVAFGEIGIRERVKNVLHYKKPAFWVILAAACACIAVPVCFMTQPKTAVPQPDSKAHSQTADARPEAENPPSADTDPKTTEIGITDTKRAAADQNRKAVEAWAAAFCSRDGTTIAEMLAEDASQELTDKCGFTRLADGGVEFGFSSPWPWSDSCRIVSVTEDSAEILYYAWVSDPHVTVWREQLTFKTEQDRFAVTSESIQFLDNICTAEQFEQAYPDLIIAGTMMDYYSCNGAGTALNSAGNRMLLQPDTAAVCLLNLLNNQNKVSTQVTEDDGDKNRCTVSVTFHLPPKKTVSITMIRPYGADGIWVPYSEAPAYGPVTAAYNVDDLLKKDAMTLEALFPDHHSYTPDNDLTLKADLDGDGVEEKIELTDLHYNGGDGGYALTVTDTETGRPIPLPDGYTKESGFPVTSSYAEPELIIGLGKAEPDRIIAKIQSGALLRIYERKGYRDEIKERMLKYLAFETRTDAVSGCRIITREGESTPTLVLKSYVSGDGGHSDTLGYIITELKLTRDHTWNAVHYFLLDGCEYQESGI